MVGLYMFIIVVVIFWPIYKHLRDLARILGILPWRRPGKF